MVRIKYSLLAKIFALVFFILFILPSLLNLFSSSPSPKHHEENHDDHVAVDAPAHGDYPGEAHQHQKVLLNNRHRNVDENPDSDQKPKRISGVTKIFLFFHDEKSFVYFKPV